MSRLRKIIMHGQGVFFAVCAALFCIGCVQLEAANDAESGGTVVSGEIRASDAPTGWASVGAKSNFGGYGGSAVTVSDRAALIAAAKFGGKVIYVDGMIDMSGGMLPSVYDDSTAGLDALIAEKTDGSYSTYASWRTAYAASCKDSADGSSDSALAGYQAALSKAWKAQIQLSVASNTTLIGLTSDSGIAGSTISISGVSNIAVRNMTIRDAYDPFPDMEKNDGFNAEYDGICIQGTSSNIWIDRCTFADSFSNFNKVTTGSGTPGVKWQTYDGLCDIKGNSRNITVSYCKFMNHDKTMLIGSSDSESLSVTRTVTLHHNYYYNCVQRLPMVRMTNIHIFNNYYDADSASYANSYAIGVRKNAAVYAEKNCFGCNIKYSYSGATGTSAKGSLFAAGDSDNSANKGRTDQFATLAAAPFSVPYRYEAADADTLPAFIKANAGAGILPVVR